MGEGREIQFQLEKKMTIVKVDLSTSIDRNLILEEELTKVETKLEKSFKWTIYSQAMINPHSQKNDPSSLVRLVKSNNVVLYIKYGEEGHSKDRYSS